MDYRACPWGNALSWSSTPISHGIATSVNAPVSVTINTTGADFAVAFIVYQGGNTYTVSDNKSNTWHPLTVQTGDGWTQIWYTQGGTFGGSHIITATLATGSNPSYIDIIASCWSGSKPLPFDNESGSASVLRATSCSPGSGGITPVGPNELFIVGLGLSNGSGAAGGEAGTPVTIDSGFTIMESNNAGVVNTNFGASLAYLLSPTSANIKPTWSWPANAPWSSPMAAFQIPPESATGTLAFGPPVMTGAALFETPSGPGTLAFGPISMGAGSTATDFLPTASGSLRQFWTL